MQFIAVYHQGIAGNGSKPSMDSRGLPSACLSCTRGMANDSSCDIGSVDAISNPAVWSFELDHAESKKESQCHFFIKSLAKQSLV